MRKNLPAFATALVVLAVLQGPVIRGGPASGLGGKEKSQPFDPNDPTYRLFQFLDSNRGGKLQDLYVIADVYKDPKIPDKELQHVLRADYDKNRAFGKFSLYVRSVEKITPEQMKNYTPKQFYEFGEVDSEKFVKTSSGALGATGDIYLHADESHPLATAPITDELRKAYEVYLTRYLLPWLESK